jgi:hypothetical protein
MERDSRGRRRQPEQERGLRPLHPILPEAWQSRALRVAMPEADWERFEALVHELAADSSTQARAYGKTISHLVQSVPEPSPSASQSLAWMEWERRKTLRLLFPGS